jgi:hypothetical protein
MNNCKEHYEKTLEKNPKEILTQGYEKLLKNEEVAAGSSTALIINIIYENNVIKMSSTNLGDSAFMIIRDFKTLYKSKEQEHQFNFPFQLGKLTFLKEAIYPEWEKNIENMDFPAIADDSNMNLIKNDYLVIGILNILIFIQRY